MLDSISTGARRVREHAARRRAERGELHRLLRKLGVDYVEIRTDTPYMPTLVSFFERRRRRFAR